MVMRVIAGKHKMRRIESLDKDSLRPTSGRTREAIFNILSHGRFIQEDKRLFDDCTVLDLFCGTGALGVEALSRGASRAVFVDIDAKHLDVARKNIAHIGETDHAVFIRSDSANPPSAKFPCNLIFLDPPYESGLIAKAFKNLLLGGWVAENAVVVTEFAKHEVFDCPAGFEVAVDRLYGKTRVVIFVRGLY